MWLNIGSFADQLEKYNDPIISNQLHDFPGCPQADRMLDMGFEPQIKEILERVPEGRNFSDGAAHTFIVLAERSSRLQY